MNKEQMIEVIKVEPEGMGNPIVMRVDSPSSLDNSLQNVWCLLDFEEDGEKLMIWKERMTIGDYNALPEHEGW